MAGKVAVVTGAARGIGRAIAERFVAEGARVVLADIDADAGAATARSLGEAARFVACDVGDRAEVEAVMAAAVAGFGGLDVCVANAGIGHAAPFLEFAEEDFDRVIRVNLKGVFLTGQAAARRMVAAGTPGAIVTLSSCQAVMVIPELAAYVASKGGINQLTKAMALSLAPHGIRVNAIGPGSIRTEMLEAVMVDETMRRRILSRTPLGRVGEADEIARIAVFLATEDSSYVTGQTIYADGGRLALNYTVPVED